MKRMFYKRFAAVALTAVMLTSSCAALGEGYAQGDVADEVAAIQTALTKLDLYYADITGRYGERTQAAVKKFQKKYSLAQTGVADKETLRWLYEESGVGIPKGSILNGYAIGAANDSVLSSGEQSPEVRDLQEALTALGYYKGEITGRYGNLTMEAVRQFQKKNGLTADAVAGPRTLEKLNAMGKGSVGTSSTASATLSASGTSGVLKKGDSSSAVRTLQENLTALGYYDGVITGSYGNLTAEAVRRFQKKNRLSADGVYGKRTQEKLESMLAGKKTDSKSESSAKEDAKEESKGNTQTAGTTLLRKGDESAAVRTLQQNLEALGYYDGTITGSYGNLTAEAVRRFQKKNGLTADGVAGKKTLAAIEAAMTKKTQKAEEEKKAEEYANSTAGKASKVLNTYFSAWRKDYANGQTCTVYDFVTGRSWKLRILSKDKHMDAEPLTAEDTTSMNKAFEGMKAWVPKAVWVTFSDGKTYIGSTHNVAHGTQSVKNNNFEGHICVHFPMPMEDAEAIGPNATNFQKVVVSGWAATQALAK